MRLPERPPDTWALWRELDQSPARAEAILRAPAGPTHEGRYRHWDRLKYYKPPAGLDHRKWWLAIKIARSAHFKPTALLDLEGRPFVFGTPDPIPEYLHDIDEDLLRKIKPSQPELGMPGTQRSLLHSLIEESITSSQLEGASTTRGIAREMIRTGRAPTNRSERMIRNNYQAMQRIRQVTDRPLTEDLLLELHMILTAGTLDNPSAEGRFRQADEPICVSDTDNEVLHAPPRAEDLRRRTSAMLDFANGNTPDYFLHPVVRSIVLHFWLAYDHPFVDGNGRCARALFYWSMLRHGYRLCEYLSISQIIRNAPVKYGTAFLYTETDENDLTYFILYHLEVIRRAVESFRSYLADTTKRIRQTQRLMRASAGVNYRQLALLTHALREPDAEYTIRSHQSSHHVTHQTARMDLYDLANRRLLTKRKIGRTFYFYPAEDLEAKLRELE